MKKIHTFSFMLVGALLLIGAGCTPTQTPATNAPTNASVNTVNENTQDQSDRLMQNATYEGTVDEAPETEGLVEPLPSEEGDAEQGGGKTGEYVAYDAEAVSDAATNGDAVLFFHASWCPTCKALNDDIEASLADIPEGLTIFKTDYDTYTELKQKYGVTYQHTLVHVDAEGEMITKWSGGNTLQSIIDKVQ